MNIAKFFFRSKQQESLLGGNGSLWHGDLWEFQSLEFSASEEKWGCCIEYNDGLRRRDDQHDLVAGFYANTT